MSVHAGSDLLSVPITGEKVNEGEYLSDVSPKHKPWDQHRGEADDVGQVYASSREARHWRLAERMASCSQVLEFARDPPKHDAEQKITLKKAHFVASGFAPPANGVGRSSIRRLCTARCRGSLRTFLKPGFFS